MWISRWMFGEIRDSRLQVQQLTAELATVRAIVAAGRATHESEKRAITQELESKLVLERALRHSAEGRVKMLENSFEWLSTSHERLERWFAELMHAKANVAIPVSTLERTAAPPLLGIPTINDKRPAGEGIPEDQEPGGLEELYRRNSGALFEDVGDALAAREGLSGHVYEGVEAIGQG